MVSLLLQHQYYKIMNKLKSTVAPCFFHAQLSSMFSALNNSEL